MTSIVGYADYKRFESWALENYPDEFAMWEMSDMSELLDFDEWASMECYEIIDAWYAYGKPVPSR
jgi:hypothetical protein